MRRETVWLTLLTVLAVINLVLVLPGDRRSEYWALDENGRLHATRPIAASSYHLVTQTGIETARLSNEPGFRMLGPGLNLYDHDGNVIAEFGTIGPSATVGYLHLQDAAGGRGTDLRGGHLQIGSVLAESSLASPRINRIEPE